MINISYTGNRINEDELIIDFFRLIIAVNMQTKNANSLPTLTRSQSREITNTCLLKGRRQLTTQHIERYIFCLNLIQEKKVIPIIEI